jgi:pyruvate ferredoxin oxidoreductase alpha subunit
MPVKIPDQKEIDDFLPSYKTGWILDVNNPLSHANLVSPDWYMEFRYMIQEAMENAKKILPSIDREYEKRFGFGHGGLVEKYKCEDADLILFTMGTMGSEAKIAVNQLRKEGLKECASIAHFQSKR